MDLKGEYRIPAARETVWAMLNDPDVLRECIPGCESLEGSAADGFAARVTTKVGPVKATFNGSVTLSNVNPPESYRISGEGKGGVAGFAKGGADVHLAEDGAGTVLTYVVTAQVGGKLAQLGSRLIDSTARKLAEQFFTCFVQRAAGEGVAGVAALPVMPGEPIPPAATGVPIVAGQAAAPETIPPLEAMPGNFVSVEDAAAMPVLPGEPIPRAATGVPIVEGQAAAPETIPPLEATPADVVPVEGVAANAPIPEFSAAEGSQSHVIQDAAHDIQEAAYEVEEEIEAKAAAGFLGGPIVWALLVMLALLFVYVITDG